METSSILQIVSLCIAILELEIQILVNQQENVTRWYSFFSQKTLSWYSILWNNDHDVIHILMHLLIDSSKQI